MNPVAPTLAPDPAAPVLLHGYFRSSAAWRVRIALHHKGIAFAQKSYALRDGEQRSPEFLALNPQGLVPALEIDGLLLTQSLAICEYLDQTRPEPALLPADAAGRARVRALALAIACEIHPVQNLRVLRAVAALSGERGTGEAWARRICTEGLEAYAGMVRPTMGAFSFGDTVTLADVLLVPQMANARRFKVDMVWPELAAIEARCLALPAFAETAPERQPDADPA